jgi:DNA-binding transcriptional ArsR family regulator
VTALAALAQDNRLQIFRLLVRVGPDGMAAGQVAETLGLAPNTLTFHFDRLRMAGLITVRRDGRSMIYTAQFETMRGLLAYLAENCCAGVPTSAVKKGCAPSSSRKRVKDRT